MRHMTELPLCGVTMRQHRQQVGLSQAKLAELTGVPQHVLSAFELGKSQLPAPMVAKVVSALARPTDVAALSQRRKRYAKHTYSEAPILLDRAARARKTEQNSSYVTELDELASAHASNQGLGFKAVSLFSGCGGFSLGFSAAGFALNGFVELDPDLRRIYRANFRNSVEIGGDIASLSDASIQRHAATFGEIDAIIGGPPCQGFSLAGKREVADPRNSLFRHYLRFVDAMRPKVALLENVRLLTSMKSVDGESVKDQIIDEFQRHGYRVAMFDINAKSYGVPQHRERVIFVATRADLGIAPSIPAATHGTNDDLFAPERAPTTFADACSDLAYLESGGESGDPLHRAVHHPDHVVRWLWDVPEGRSAHDNEDAALRPPSGYNTTYKRQVWHEPAATVQTTFGMISGCRNVHPIATRSLTVREAARVQSFPDRFQFPGVLGSTRTGIGNAVPPLLAFVLAKHVRALLQSL
jgi:DNA (cytosine-5)-methyltransferase 1